MNLNPYEASQAKDRANNSAGRSRSSWLLIFLLDFGVAFTIIYAALNLRSLLGLEMPRRYASYEVEFETPFSILNWETLSTVFFGLMALAIAFTSSMARVVFERRKSR